MILYASALLPIGMFELQPTGAIIVPLGIALGAVVLALIVWAAIRGTMALRKKTIAAWQQASEELGIIFHTPGRFASYLMEGNVAGFQVKIHTYTQSSGQHSSTYTAFRVSFPGSLDLGMKLSRELALVSGIAKFFGAQDILTGDESFDNTFVIKGSEPDPVIDFLDEDIRRQLIELQQAQKGMGIIVTDTDISVTQGGVARDGDAIITLVTDLTRMAFVLAGQLIDNRDLA